MSFLIMWSSRWRASTGCTSISGSPGWLTAAGGGVLHRPPRPQVRLDGADGSGDQGVRGRHPPFLSASFFEPDREGFGQTVTRWMPLPGTQQRESFADVPPSVADAAAEAVLCVQAGALRGAIMLARAVIEATAKDKGVTDGSLSKKIDQLHERGYVRTYLRDGVGADRVAARRAAWGPAGGQDAGRRHLYPAGCHRDIRAFREGAGGSELQGLVRRDAARGE